MAKLVFGMNQSLDGYVDHLAFAPGPTLFRHFIGEAERQAGSVYGRRMYEIMRYWDDDHPEWEAPERAFAAAWRKQPKWVVSRTLKSLGPNASLVGDDLEGAIRRLKAGRDGEIEVAGPNLAQSLTELGLIDEYRIYLHPVVLGRGTPYFAGPRPPLRLMTHDRIGEDVIRLTYVPASHRQGRADTAWRARDPLERMRPKELVLAWVDAFNRADADALAELYAEDAINHQVAEAPVRGRAAIRRMFATGFASAKMTCLVENLFEDGDWAILEWRDPLGLRGCGFFQVANGRISFQRGYWDKLTFLRARGLPPPE